MIDLNDNLYDLRIKRPKFGNFSAKGRRRHHSINHWANNIETQQQNESEDKNNVIKISHDARWTNTFAFF